jgi:hypothetical protein
MALQLLVAGTDRTNFLLTTPTPKFTRKQNERAMVEMSFKPGFLPAQYADFTINDGATTIFRGVLIPHLVEYDRGRSPIGVECTGYDYAFFEDVCYWTKKYTGPKTAKQILTDLVAEKLSVYGITLDPAQDNGDTFTDYAVDGVLVADVLRQLGDAHLTPRVHLISPLRQLKLYVPGTVNAPFSITDAAASFYTLGWSYSDVTPVNDITIAFGPSSVGDTAITQIWIGDGTTRVFSLKGINIHSSSEWPGVCFVGGVQLPVWPPGQGPTDHIEWDYATNDGQLTFIGGGTASAPGVGVPIQITYFPQYPFEVNATTGATPKFEVRLSDDQTPTYQVAVASVQSELLKRNMVPRELLVSTWQYCEPGQRLSVQNAARALPTATVFTVAEINAEYTEFFSLGTRLWVYTIRATETTIYQGSYLDQIRELFSGGGSGGGGTVLIPPSGGGGGAMSPLPPGYIYIGDSTSTAVANPVTGDIVLSTTGRMDIAAGAIVNADISATAGITDNKLATISTSGKVANSATTATPNNVANTIVLRNSSGDFSAGSGFFASQVAGAEVYASSFFMGPLLKTNANIDITISPGNGGGGHLRLTPSVNLWLDPFNVVVLRDTKPLTSSTVYASGFGGTGFTLNHSQTFTNQSYLELDQLRVRGVMNVYEFVVNQIRSTNGNLFVTNCARISSVSLVNTNYYDIFTEAPHGFQPNDLIRAQRFSAAGGGAAVFQTDIIVNALGSDVWFGGTVLSGPPPAPGMDFVRLGNTTDSTRRGSIYLTADDVNAPYINVLNGVDSIAAWGAQSTLRVRLGNLIGSYGYSGAPVYGLAAGNAAGAWFSIDATNGLRMSYGSTVYMQIDTVGNATFSGTVRVGNVTIDQSGIRVAPYSGSFSYTAAYMFDIPGPAAPSNGIGYWSSIDGNDIRTLEISHDWNGNGNKPHQLWLHARGDGIGSAGAGAVSANIYLYSDGGGSTYSPRIDFALGVGGGPVDRYLRLQPSGLSWDTVVAYGSHAEVIIANSGLIARRDIGNVFAGGMTINNTLNVNGITQFATACYFNGLIQSQSVSPNIQMFKTNGAVNEKYTRWLSDASECDLQLVDDGYSVATNTIRTTRIQHVIATVERGDNLSTFNVVSDMNAKTNVRPVSKATQRDLMRSLQIYEFDYTGDFGIKVGPGIGPLAQEAMAVFPNSVQTIMRSRHSSDPDPVNWSAAEALLVFNPDTLYMAHVAYTQALDDEVELLKARVTALEGL